MMEDQAKNNKGFWDGYNNVGIGVVALASALNHLRSMSTPKALLVIPLIVHRPTLAYMANKVTLERGSAALVSGHPHLFANFKGRFESTLPLSLNSIQLLVHLGYAKLGDGLVLTKALDTNAEFGQRANKIEQASKKLAELLSEPEEELYLNFRVQL
jgi:hypothetical protein